MQEMLTFCSVLAGVEKRKAYSLRGKKWAERHRQDASGKLTKPNPDLYGRHRESATVKDGGPDNAFFALADRCL